MRPRPTRGNVGGSLQVVCREYPQGDDRDGEFGTPVEHVVELLSAQTVDRSRIGETQRTPVPAVAVEDYADVPRRWPSPDLAQEPLLIDIVESAQGHQTCTLRTPPRGPIQPRGSDIGRQRRWRRMQVQ